MSQEKRAEKLKSFNPDYNGLEAKGLFGLPFNPTISEVVVVPVPWEVTVSYGAGTARAPAAIKKASQQIDLYDYHFEDAWKLGFAMDKIQPVWVKKNKELRQKALPYIKALESGKMKAAAKKYATELEEINHSCSDLAEQVQGITGKWLGKGKTVGVLGGDHSIPLGFMWALAERNPAFSILQIDAHADLRQAYEGFHFSHASIMMNALMMPAVERLVQVGVRDISQGEKDFIVKSEGRVVVHYDAGLKGKLFGGTSWKTCCEDIIGGLGQKVYISFDIDGLQPHLCPNTGTPVPGGLSFEQAISLIDQVLKSGRQIIGFDLCEVSPGKAEWDANVGARVLYKLCGFAAMSAIQSNSLSHTS